MCRSSMSMRKVFFTLGACALLLSFGLANAQATPYVATDIGTLGGTYASPKAISSTGQIVGQSSDAAGIKYAFSYTVGGGFVQLPWSGTYPSSPPGSSAVAYAVNSSGDVAGQQIAMQYGPPIQSALEWSNIGGPTQVTDLGNIGNTMSVSALGINDSGIAVGYGLTASYQTHAIRFSGESATDLGVPSGYTASKAYAINNAGDFVGSVTDGSSITKAMLYTGGSITDLGLTTGAKTSVANAINNTGTIAGYVQMPDPYDCHAMLYDIDTSTMSDVGTLSGYANTEFLDLNDGGVAVGFSYGTTQNTSVAVVYDDGVFYDLNDLAPVSGWTLGKALGINNAGQIVCEGRQWIDEYSYNTHAFLLNPVPEPSTFVLLIAGIVGLLAYAWRKGR